jgi:hypothetical protein
MCLKLRVYFNQTPYHKLITQPPTLNSFHSMPVSTLVQTHLCAYVHYVLAWLCLICARTWRNHVSDVLLRWRIPQITEISNKIVSPGYSQGVNAPLWQVHRARWKLGNFSDILWCDVLCTSHFSLQMEKVGSISTAFFADMLLRAHTNFHFKSRL